MKQGENPLIIIMDLENKINQNNNYYYINKHTQG